MKLLTLNTHSLIEKNYLNKTSDFTAAVSDICPDIIALQEVNQSCKAHAVQSTDGYCPCNKNVIIRDDNHVNTVVKMLKKSGLDYFWTWLPIKIGYDKYDEGIAIMSLSPITATNVMTISHTDDYYNWRTRKIVGIQTADTSDDWFYSVHFSWWDDSEEPFSDEWKRVHDALSIHKNVWLMGDFNNPAEIRNEGYDTIKASRFKDSYTYAKSKDSGITVAKVIDGWHDKISDCNGMRIDQIWFSGDYDIKSSEVIFNGTNYPVVSDHFGIMIEY